MDCRNQAIFEFELFRDGIEIEFVSIENIISQFSNSERNPWLKLTVQITQVQSASSTNQPTLF